MASAEARPAGAQGELRILSVLGQKVQATGSGVVVKEIADRAHHHGVRLAQLCATEDGDDPAALFGPSNRSEIVGVPFGGTFPEGLPFPIVGMSNEMPYASMRFRDLTSSQLDQYLTVWEAYIASLARRFRPHLFHVHHLWLLAALVARRWPDVPVVVSIHGTDLRRADEVPRLKALVQPCVAQLSALVTLTDEDEHRVGARYGGPLPAIHALGNGFNPTLFKPTRPVDEGALARYGIAPGPRQKVVLCVAKYDPAKGIEWLLRAFARVRPAGTEAPLLVICGGGPAAERARYEQVAETLGIRRRVVLTGPVAYEDVGAIVQAADVFALPAFHEPFGLAILEALASGRPVVTTDQGGPPRFIPPGLVRDGDVTLVPGLSALEPAEGDGDAFVAAIAGAIERHLAETLTPERRQRIAGAVAGMSWDHYLGRLVAVYRRCATRTAVSA